MQMILTAANAKATVDPMLVAEFDCVFSAEPADAIEWAFRTWRNKSAYFPAISEIRELLNDWHRGKREQAELKARQDEKRRLEEARKRGELVDFTDILKKFRETMDIQPEPEHVKREREFRLRMERGRS
jgi:hypothetical protein